MRYLALLILLAGCAAPVDPGPAPPEYIGGKCCDWTPEYRAWFGRHMEYMRASAVPNFAPLGSAMNPIYIAR